MPRDERPLAAGIGKTASSPPKKRRPALQHFGRLQLERVNAEKRPLIGHKSGKFVFASRESARRSSEWTLSFSTGKGLETTRRQETSGNVACVPRGCTRETTSQTTGRPVQKRGGPETIIGPAVVSHQNVHLTSQERSSRVAPGRYSGMIASQIDIRRGGSLGVLGGLSTQAQAASPVARQWLGTQLRSSRPAGSPL
jgi:hypothetical protein